jgi:hypothetical protein
MGFNKAAGDLLTATELNSFYSSAGLYAASSTGNDSYAITVTPTPNDYDAGDTYTFKADVGNTGAATLNVNSLGAKTIKKFGTLDLENGDITAGQIVTVKYDGTNFQIASEVRPTSFFQQDIILANAETIVDGDGFAAGSNQSGSVLYFIVNNTILYRCQRDALTGQFTETHRVDPTLAIPSGDSGGIIVIGSFIYVFTNDGTNIVCSRFSAADLTGEQVMTVPTVACTNFLTAWTDGVDAYLISNASSTTSRRWTVSGTTFTAAGTATVSTFVPSRLNSSMYDGNNAYVIQRNGVNLYQSEVFKLTNIDGSTKTTTTIPLSHKLSDVTNGRFIINIDATRIYVGLAYTIYNELNADVVQATGIRLYPITKP